MQELPNPSLYQRNLFIDDKFKVKEAEKLLSWFKDEVDFQMNIFLDKKIEEAREISEEATILVDEVKRFVFAGGKRVRPAFLYSGYIAAGGKAHAAATFASLCVEFLHTFALIHDDIIDRSDTRRGKPTSHKAFENIHKSKKYLGDREHFGLSSAILAGDLAFTFAEEILTSSPFPQERLRRARYFFDQMKFQVITGEYLDVLGSYKKRLTEEEVLNILEYKTAKYTVERPLQIGAMLAGAEVAILESFTAYGIPLGQAFQLQDDILGIFGDAEKIGKPVGADIREGKKTVLIAKTYEWASKKEEQLLDRVVGNWAATDKDLSRVKEIIYSVGAYGYAIKLSHRLIDQAKTAIDKDKYVGEGKEYLLVAADYLLNRIS